MIPVFTAVLSIRNAVIGIEGNCILSCTMRAICSAGCVIHNRGNDTTERTILAIFCPLIT